MEGIGICFRNRSIITTIHNIATLQIVVYTVLFYYNIHYFYYLSGCIMKNIQIILGSTRQNRHGEKIAKWVNNQAKERKDWQVELLDLRDYDLPFYDEAIPSSMNKGVYTNAEGARWAKKISEGDGYIIVTPEYNHGYPAVLKNALDYPYHEWGNKPVAFVSYGGGAGAARAVEQLREVVAELKMVSVRDALHFVMFHPQVSDEGVISDITWNDRLHHLFDQLDWWTTALKTARSHSK